ncbi:MAG: ABC transporter permease [Planctomycetes bacterium]|nr:ABC transporter permease [Planctomycetota bacterium]
MSLPLEQPAHLAVALATPIALAAVGETIVESTGVLFLGLEGAMLVGALGAVLGAHASGSAAVGVFCGIAAGSIFALLFAFLTLKLRADDVIAGTAMNLLAAGGTAVAWRAALSRAGGDVRAPGLEPLTVPLLSEIPFLGTVLFQHHAITYALILVVPAAGIFLFRTSAGLRWRAAGESPLAAASLGIATISVRARALGICGALAGAGGACLSIADTRTFVEGMTAGRGFLALALVIFGNHRPGWVGSAALLFGGALAAQYGFAAAGWNVAPEAFRALPYVLSLAVLALFVGKRRAPSGLGQGLG